MKNNWINKAFLFRDIPIDEASRILDSINVDYRDYFKGQSIYLPDKFDKKIGFVVEGECRVQKMRTDGAGIPLNNLMPGDAFGVIPVFTGCEEFPTGIKALKNTRIAYFSKDIIESLMNENVVFSMNIIRFLADRIVFLNSKISSFSSDNVEQKTALYLLNLFREQNDECIKFNKKSAAEAINVGRTSLYRALDLLEKDGAIKIDEKNIIIIDIKCLERKTK